MCQKVLCYVEFCYSDLDHIWSGSVKTHECTDCDDAESILKSCCLQTPCIWCCIFKQNQIRSNNSLLGIQTGSQICDLWVVWQAQGLVVKAAPALHKTTCWNWSQCLLAWVWQQELKLKGSWAEDQKQGRCLAAVLNPSGSTLWPPVKPKPQRQRVFKWRTVLWRMNPGRKLIASTQKIKYRCACGWSILTGIYQCLMQRALILEPCTQRRLNLFSKATHLVLMVRWIDLWRAP